jgi:hypothetical protein
MKKLAFDDWSVQNLKNFNLRQRSASIVIITYPVSHHFIQIVLLSSLLFTNIDHLPAVILTQTLIIPSEVLLFTLSFYPSHHLYSFKLY